MSSINKLILLVVTFLIGVGDSIAGEQIYSFGIGPQQAASELAKRWTPLLDYISEKSGTKLSFTTAKDIPTYQDQMASGAFDFAFINPYHYTIFHKKAGYVAFAREKDGMLRGVLVAQINGKVQKLDDLKGQTLAFPAPTALAATWLPIHHLETKNIAVTPQYVNSMDSVYRAVAKGLFPAGGGEERTFALLDPAIKSQLKVLWLSETLPPFTFAVHPRVPPEIVQRIQKAMVELTQDAKATELLRPLNMKAFEKATDADYNALRAMKLQPMKQ